MKSITVRVQNVYGKEVVYPVCDGAIAFAKLAGTKTLTDAALDTIQFDLGYSVKVDHAPLPSRK